MNSLITKVDLANDVFAQLRRGNINETAALARLEVKLEQISRDMKKLSALLCSTCEEIGQPESIDLTVNLGSAIDE